MTPKIPIFQLEIRQAIAKRMIKNIEQRIENALNHVNTFVFPGGRQFFMRNPAFNKNNDLLLELEYK